MRRALAVGALVGSLIGPSTAGAAPEVDAGALRAEVTGDPWHLELTDAKGRVVLSESEASAAAPAGPLGFRTLAGWEQATRIVSSERTTRRFTAMLATTDPARTMAVEIARSDEGIIDVEAEVLGDGPAVDAIGIGFEARRGERYLGLGERSNAVDQSGNVVENYVSDGPYQENEYPVINAFTPTWGIREGHPESTYYPVPWLLSTAGYGVLVDDPQTSYFRLRADDPGAWSVGAPAVLRRPGARRRPAPLRRGDRTPAEARRALAARAVVPGGRRRARGGRPAPGGGRSPVRPADLHALSAMRRPGR